MNPNKGNLLRKIFISSIVFVAIVSAIALFSWKLVDHKIRYLLSVIESNSPDAEGASNALLLLNEAESDFQMAVFSSDRDRLLQYKSKLQTAFGEIDSLNKRQPDSIFPPTPKNNVEISGLYQKKLLISEQILSLKSIFDSLLFIANRSFETKQLAISQEKYLPKRQAIFERSSDTTIQEGAPVPLKRKGLFRRLKDAFSNKGDTTKGPQVKLVTNEKKYKDSVIQLIARNAINFYRRSFNDLRKKQQEISHYQSALFTANQEIMGRLKALVADLKDVSLQLSANIKNIALHQYHSTAALQNGATILCLFLLVFFSALLIWYIRKIQVAETIMRMEHDRVASLAQQKTDLLAAMTHEIRNPLYSIIGFLKELRSSRLTDQQTEMMNAIQLSSDMLLGSVNDVLDITKLESGEFQLHSDPFNPYTVLRLTTETMRFSAQNKHLELGYSFEGDQQLNVEGDSFRLKQVLLNLLTNAIKFTEKGSVHVRAGLTPSNGQATLQVSVSDTGAGIPKTQQQKLFTKYYQTATAKGQIGTGLGLFICQKLVQFQNGVIQVNSTPLKGSEFTFSIPYSIVQGNKSDRTLERSDVDISVFAGKKILVADDNEINLRLIQIMVRNWEIDLFLTEDGEDALKIIKENKIDIVLTDMHMLRMSGMELVANIRNSDNSIRRIPVVLISGNEYDDAEISRLKQKGFSDVITKPFNEMLLAQKLFHALQ